MERGAGLTTLPSSNSQLQLMQDSTGLLAFLHRMQTTLARWVGCTVIPFLLELSMQNSFLAWGESSLVPLVLDDACSRLEASTSVGNNESRFTEDMLCAGGTSVGQVCSVQRSQSLPVKIFYDMNFTGRTWWPPDGGSRWSSCCGRGIQLGPWMWPEWKAVCSVR